MTTTGPMPPAHLRPPEPPPPPRRPRGNLPLLLAGCALAVSLLAAGASLVALSRSAGSTTAPASAGSIDTASAAALPTGATPTDVLPTDATETAAPTEEPTSEPTGGPDPSGVYEVAYQSEPLVLQPSSRYVDLDEPSGNASGSVYELQYEGFAPGSKLEFSSEVALASINSPSPTANDCAKQLRREPIDTTFAPSKGQLICVLTSRSAADDQGIRQKIVLMKVNSITQDGTLNLTLTAWTVPR